MKNLTPAELAAVAAVDRDRIADDLQALVRVPSVTGDEAAVQTEVGLRMATAGLEVERVDADPGVIASDPDFPGMEAPRSVLPVVAGRLRGDRAGPRAIICGHVDVVGPGDESQWGTPPFSAEISDGVLYGRGACDMKGGVVAGLAALRALVDIGAEPAGEALLVTVPAEEDGGAGMLAAIRAGYVGDAAVITEPTGLEIVTAQAGAITFRVTVKGRAAHAAYRREGVSALEKGIRIVQALEADETRRNAAETNPVMRDIGLPYPTNLGMIRGGEWASTVPDELVIAGRYGVRLDETVGDAEAALRAAVAVAAGEDEWLSAHPPKLEITGGRFAPAALENRHPLPWSVGEAARDVLGKLPAFVGVPYGSDMRLLLHQGRTPTVLYGPGDAADAHGPNEHVALEDVAHCARVLAVWLLRTLGS